MITLPDWPSPNGASPALIDYGIVLRPSSGAKVQRVDRAGSRFRIAVSYPPMTASDARVFISRFLQAKSEGIRIEYPLLGIDQGVPGLPVVDGAGQSGSSLLVRGLNPSYTFKEGFWISIEDSSGQHYLHNVKTSVAADSSGELTLSILPALRANFADGDTIHVNRPMIEGFVEGESWQWELPVEQLVALAVTIEEAA